ncbi:hypothetical protein ACFQ10_43935 [Streptomyces indonesiensis]
MGAGASASAGAGAAAGAGGGYEAGGDTGAGAGGEAERTGPAKQLAVKEDAKLGKFVTDSKGWTLYRFDEDTPKGQVQLQRRLRHQVARGARGRRRGHHRYRGQQAGLGHPRRRHQAADPGGLAGLPLRGRQQAR